MEGKTVMNENEIKETEVKDRLDGRVDPDYISTGSQPRMADIIRTMKDFFQKKCGECPTSNSAWN